MIFTITTQCRSKGMITNSVVRTVWKQRYTPQKTKLRVSSYIPRRLRITTFKDE
jgi:hypothetical protein